MSQKFNAYMIFTNNQIIAHGTKYLCACTLYTYIQYRTSNPEDQKSRMNNEIRNSTMISNKNFLKMSIDGQCAYVTQF